ncbi:hypothetical protein D1007_43877 [Hordeum vulgare]|nr:hypothetical protein D1007_43877 [Hordeum vulgare]
MAKASKVSPTLNPNVSHDDDVDDNEDENNDEDSDIISSLIIKGEIIFKCFYKNKLACSNFLEIMSIATEDKKYIEELEAHLEEHEATIETMEGHERDYANEIVELYQTLENEQTTKESLEETFAIELSRLKESHDRALEENVELRDQLELLSSNYGKLEEIHVMFTSSHDDLLVSHNVLKLAHKAITTKVTSRTIGDALDARLTYKEGVETM